MAQTMLRDHLQQTEDALSSGHIDDALAHCQHVLTHFPGSLEAQRLLGEIYLAQGHLEEARQTFDWVLTSDPENVVAYCDRALISEHMADADTALDCYQQAYELSRGNSQIRQEFNQLSTKVGQPHFMFSRAGLARLYMRGDLLSLAIQEWEIVLTATPDRLDARTGLLEALWREGLNDRVEQLAKQILVEIPTCLKALLILAHVTSTHNITQARDLIRRAEALDPELVMAHELFSDLTALQPNDPFLALINKSPIALPEVNHPLATTSTAATASQTPGAANGTSKAPVPTDPLFGWSSLDSVVESQKDYQESPEYSIWSSSDLQTFDSTRAELQDMNLPTPPAWLDILTQGEQRPSSGALTHLPPSPSTEQEPPVAMTSVSPVPPVEPEAQMPHEELPHQTPFSPLTSSSEDTDAANWPEWLKSLGATEMGNDPPAEAPTVVPELQQSLYSQSWMEQTAQSPAQRIPSPAWSDQAAEPPAQQTAPAWMDQMASSFTQQPPAPQPDQVAEPPAQQIAPAWIGRVTRPSSELEEHTPITLEDLEHNLHTQGFVELEPGSLSTIAQSTQEPTLSSALAQLGSVNLSVPPQTAMPVYGVPSVPPIVESSAQPSWSDPATPYLTPTVLPKPPVEPSAIPSYRADALLENELETTMKRPAIRLQPMQQRPTVQRDLESPGGKIRFGEHPLTDGSTENYPSPRERLLRGYQHQLAGDYDEAMQEYRVIIRGAPELLGEIISNVRALLKLAPKYAIGYRVLGDAYMRQGEYLQAMEAYNKALSMSKKAQGQGR